MRRNGSSQKQSLLPLLVGGLSCLVSVVWNDHRAIAQADPNASGTVPAVGTAQVGSTAPTNASATAVYPLDCIVKATGEAVIVDRNLPGLFQWKDGQLSVLIQGPKKFRQPLNAARSIAVEASGDLLVGDSSTREVYRISGDGKLQPLTGGQIGIPIDIAVRADGSFVVGDMETRRVLSVSADGKQIKELGALNPRGVFVDSKDQVWVVSQDAAQLQVIGTDGKVRAVVAKRTFDFPHQVVVNSKGEAFVSDGYKKAIWKVVEGSEPQVVVSGAPLDNPVGLALSGDEILVTDPRAAQVFKLVDGSKLEPWFAIKK